MNKFWQRTLSSSLAVMFIALTFWLAASVSERNSLDRLADASRHRLDIYVTSLRNAVDRYSYLPYVLSLNQELQWFLQQPHDSRLRDRANHYLSTVNASAKASTLYLLDVEGKALASSNWNTAQSYVGNDYSFRPYYQQAMQGKAGRFYGVGTTTGEAGYFLSWPVYDKHKIIGIVVAKVNLEVLESNWRQGGDHMLVADNHDIVILTTEPQWKMHALVPPDKALLQQIEQTRQYSGAFAELPIRARQTLNGSASTLDIMLDNKYVGMLAQTASLPDIGWKITLFTDLTPVRQTVRSTLIGTSLGVLLLLSSLLYWRLRRRRLRDNQAAREALQRAYDELEHKVNARTQDLQQSNEQLAREIVERQRTENDLRETQNELVQAAKLAVLGQMAAGITHELNQPLTAMRSLADNAQTFLAQERTDYAGQNLRLIAQLVDRMGKITGQLRAFARKSGNQTEAVSLGDAVKHATLLLEQRLQQQNVQFDIPDGLDKIFVRCNAVRLEQVLINLLRNALDALCRTEQARISLTVQHLSGNVLIRLSDNGPGIPPEVRPHLFDPFFTTKGGDEGLGLGLAISLSIIRDCGGKLTVESPIEGGACFVIELREEHS